MKAAALAVIALVGTAFPAASQEISETLSKPLRATLTSSKQPIDLELCVADALTRVGGTIPIPLHEGPNKTLMLGYGHTPKIVVVMTTVPSGTKLEIYTKAGDVDERFTEYVKLSCKIG